MSDAAGTTSEKELRILRHMFHVAPVEAARRVTRLLGEFEHIGPNGTHPCLVFEPMGPTVNFMVEELPRFKPRTFDIKYDTLLRWPGPFSNSL